MNRNIETYRSHCPINVAQENFGDKWSLLVIRDLLLFGKNTYGEFLQSGEKISTNILADRLQKLEQRGLIKKQPCAKNKSKHIYTLTQKGIDLLPLLLEMIVWSATYDNKTEVPTEFVERVKTDRDNLVHELLNTLEASSAA